MYKRMILEMMMDDLLAIESEDIYTRDHCHFLLVGMFSEFLAFDNGEFFI